MMNYEDPWLIIELHDYVFPFWHAIQQSVLTTTMNKMRKNKTNEWTKNGHMIYMSR